MSCGKLTFAFVDYLMNCMRSDKEQQETIHNEKVASVKQDFAYDNPYFRHDDVVDSSVPPKIKLRSFDDSCLNAVCTVFFYWLSETCYRAVHLHISD